MAFDVEVNFQKPPPDVDLEFILGNMEEIADVSQKLLVNLEMCVSGKSFGEQCVGENMLVLSCGGGGCDVIT